ncbi:MAG TPA: hypothetical protein VK601_27240, partial [Kofleriaceae bacterium]|nr:hypothetical protein [Kofleriaceae bacterium]
LAGSQADWIKSISSARGFFRNAGQPLAPVEVKQLTVTTGGGDDDDEDDDSVTDDGHDDGGSGDGGGGGNSGEGGDDDNGGDGGFSGLLVVGLTGENCSCERGDSNPHAVKHRNLNPERQLKCVAS